MMKYVLKQLNDHMATVAERTTGKAIYLGPIEQARITHAHYEKNPERKRWALLNVRNTNRYAVVDLNEIGKSRNKRAGRDAIRYEGKHESALAIWNRFDQGVLR